MAGVMGPKAIRRAARWAAGVNGAFTLDGDAAAMASGVVQIRGGWRDAERADPPHLSSSVWYALGPGADERLRGYAYSYLKVFGDDIARWSADNVACSTPDALRRAVENAREAGSDEFFLVPTTSDPAELDRTRDALSA